MTLRDLLNGIFAIEGYVKVQCWEDDNNPTIYYEGYAENGIRNKVGVYIDREINYIFPYQNRPNEAAICIELSEE